MHSYVKQKKKCFLCETGRRGTRKAGRSRFRPHSAPQRLPDSGRRARELRGPQRSSPCHSCWPRGVLGPRSRAALRRRRPTLTPQGGGDYPQVTVWHTRFQARTEQRCSQFSLFGQHFGYFQCGQLRLRGNMNLLRIQR